MSELTVVDSAFDGMLAAVQAGNREDLMKLSGQLDESTPKEGLSRLNINYETETDNGKSLKKGAWKVYYNGEFVYADTVEFRPMVRTYEWSVWDSENTKFSSRSVQAPSLNNHFPDTAGGDKCGRLTKSAEVELGEDHPLSLMSRLATCNQVFYALISMKGKTANGDEVVIENYPATTYFKRSGFRPAREAIEKLGKNTLMNEVVFELGTKRHKQGSVTYFTPVFTQTGTEPLNEERMELMKMFLETIKGSNSKIIEQHKEAVKAKASLEEVDLAAEFG